VRPGWIIPLTAGLLFSSPGLAGPSEEEPSVEEGRKVFTELAQPGCPICHTLADAAATGAIGPDLDELAPDEDQVAAAVTNGVGIMPAFNETLTSEQIAAVARYVATVTGQ